MVVSFIDRIQFTDVKHLVIDEADTLLDESFREVVLDIMKSIKVINHMHILVLMILCFDVTFWYFFYRSDNPNHLHSPN